MAGLEYMIDLCKPGTLSGELVIVGPAKEHAAPKSEEQKKAVIHSFMGTGKEGPDYIEKCRMYANNSFPGSSIQKYGTRRSVLITPGVFFRSQDYNPHEMFRESDIVVVRKGPVVECFASPEEIEKSGQASMYNLPFYVNKILGMYEQDFRKGKMSWRMMWHVKNSLGFLLYRHFTRQLERVRRRIERREKRGWIPSDLHGREDELVARLR